jgi:hypothetical protein
MDSGSLDAVVPECNWQVCSSGDVAQGDYELNKLHYETGQNKIGIPMYLSENSSQCSPQTLDLHL